MTTLEITGADLSLTDVFGFDKNRPAVKLSDTARTAMRSSVAAVQRVMDAGNVCYGINTGFGAFASRTISADQLRELQYNLVRSHACGVGDPLPASITRMMMLLKANSLAVGASGIRPRVVDTLLALLNHDVLPVIPSQGSVGASGDLAPLAHLALALIGEGEAVMDGKALSGRDVLSAAGTVPVELDAKEGLALLNGTQASSALALAGLRSAEALLYAAIVTGALSVEGLAGSHRPFDARIQALRRLPGQICVAEQFRSLLTKSEINSSHANCDRVQDPYSLRCMPQVLGAYWNALKHAADVLAPDCNSVSDNPLIFSDEIISGGNFHAAPIGLVSDYLAIALTDLASMSERRTDLLVRGVNSKLNLFLTDSPGLESGFMLAHVTAAALASENKTLAHPASADSITTSAGQEDHVSMATWAGLKLQRIVRNTANVVAIELLAASRALDSMQPLTTTPELTHAHAAVRAQVPAASGDQRLDRPIRIIADWLLDGAARDLLPDPRGCAVY